MEAAELSKNINMLIAGDAEMTSLFSYFNSIGMKLDEIMEKLTAIKTLKSMMNTDVVHFVFQKVSGEIREAYGTRAMEILQHNNSIPGGQRKSSTTFPYYDIEKKAWRCFKPELLLQVYNDYGI